MTGFLSGIVAEFEQQQARDDAVEAARRGISMQALLDERQVDRDQRARAFSEQQAREAAARARQMEAEKARREAFGASLGIAAPAHVGHIIKLGGLSERSSGNGTTRGTVWHVVLDGTLTRGRLARRAGDLLCRPASTMGHRKSMAVSGTGEWGDYLTSTGQGVAVSCAACIEIMGRLKT